MTEPQRLDSKSVEVAIGFAAGHDGKGVAFARIGDEPVLRQTLRVPFAVRVRPALQGRDVAYAAANAIAEALLERGVPNVRLQLEDGRLAADLRERGPLPAPLTLPYVTLRCRLNRFRNARVEAVRSAVTRDLMGRAQAEASLDIAA